MLNGDPAVLRVLPLDDVEIGDDLEPADDRRGHRRLDKQDILKLAVDPVADPQAVFLGIEMNVGGLAVACAFQDLVDQLRQADRRGLFLEVFADIAMVLGAIGREWRRPRPARLRRRSDVAVVGRQGAQSLERELVEHLGRNQIELEDRLAQVALVLLAVDLGDRTWSVDNRPFLSKTVTRPARPAKGPETRSRRRRPTRSPVVERAAPAGGWDEGSEGSTAETSLAYVRPRVSPAANQL